MCLTSQTLASPACSYAKGSGCCALLWGLAAASSANASFLGQCFWKPWELNKHLCCSLAFSQALQAYTEGLLASFLQPSNLLYINVTKEHMGISVEFRDACNSWDPECVLLFCQQHKEYSANSKCFTIFIEIFHKEYNSHTFIFNYFQFYCTEHAEQQILLW